MDKYIQSKGSTLRRINGKMRRGVLSADNIQLGMKINVPLYFKRYFILAQIHIYLDTSRNIDE